MRINVPGAASTQHGHSDPGWLRRRRPIADTRRLAALDPLLDVLRSRGRRVIGPRERDGAIVLDEIHGSHDLPVGRVDSQEPGHYRLTDGSPGRWFDYVVGPQSWKAYLFPARQQLWSGRRTADGFEVRTPDEAYPPTVFFGVRPCDLAAIARQADVFDNGSFADPGYARRRAATLIVTVQCARSAATCFCASMNTGPRAEAGFDLALTELGAGTDHRFLVEAGSAAGQEVLDALDLPEAPQADLDAAQAQSRAAAESQTRAMPDGIAPILRDNPDHPYWEEIAQTCLACTNCTLACPTCFCSDVQEVSDLRVETTERVRVWDSCFGPDFSYIHGGAVRRTTAARYRHWMTHKLSTWHDQFGASGCVGCGRCIAWCPVGIDITAGAARIAAMPDDPAE